MGKFYKEEEKAAKLAKKLEENKIKKKVMWEKLTELNAKFKKIKQFEKLEEKNMSATILQKNETAFVRCDLIYLNHTNRMSFC